MSSSPLRRTSTVVPTTAEHVRSSRQLRSGMSIPRAREWAQGRYVHGKVRQGACPAGAANRSPPAAPCPADPVGRPRRAIKLFHAPLAGTSAPTRHVAAVRHRNPAPVVGSLVQPDQPAVGGPLRRRPVHRGPTPADRPVVQPGLRLGPAGGAGDLPRVARAALRHLLRTARAPGSPRCIRRRTNGIRASRGSPPPNRRPSRPPSPRPSASCRWKCTSFKAPVSGTPRAHGATRQRPNKTANKKGPAAGFHRPRDLSAPPAGLEPATLRLTVECSAN